MRLETRIVVSAVAVVTVLAIGGPATSGPKKKPSFKTTHVTLYDCGLAQFERQAEVRGAQELEIGVSLAHLDDMLASLVLATDDSVKVRGVKYPSVKNLGQAVAASGMGNALAPDGGGLALPADLPGYAQALVGTTVRVKPRGGKAQEGTVLACVDRSLNGQEITVPGNNGETVTKPPEKTLVLVTPEGALAWIALDEITEIAPTSKREADAIASFANQLGKANGFSETAIVLETSPGSRGKLAASYIRQIPLWRTVYKVTASPDAVWLEAWAVVHNDTAEDWVDVEMTLLSGLPESYVMSLASPRYAEREALALEEEGNMMPQLGAATPDSLLYDWEVYGYGGLGLAGYGVGGGGSGSGYGIAAGAMRGAVGAGMVAGETASSLIQVGEAAAEETMEARVEGEISTYRALNPVTIPADSSSLVPVIRRKLEGQAFTYLKDGIEPATCVRAVNGSGLVLQSGVASFYVNGRFRGQAELARTEPGDTSIWCYGTDPDVSFSRASEISQSYRSLEWRNDSLWGHNVKTTTWTYSIDNMAGQHRALAIDIRHIQNGRVVVPQDLLEGEFGTQKLFLFEVPGRSTHEQIVQIEEGVMTRVEFEIDALWDVMQLVEVPVAEREKVRTARKYLIEERQLEARVASAEEDIARLEEIISRDRTNLASIPDAAVPDSEVVDELLDEIVRSEKTIRVLKQQVESLKRMADERRKRARDTLSELTRTD
jgi:hypothetical protein